MSFSLKLNFLKGWPNPYIYEESLAAAALSEVDEGKIAHIEDGKWVVGYGTVADPDAHINLMPFVLWNGAAKDGDHGIAFDKTNAAYQQATYGGIQGIAFSNPIKFQTSQFTGTVGNFVPGAKLSVSNAADETKGKLKIAASTEVVVAICVGAAANSPGGVSMITVVPDMSKRVIS